MIEKKNKRVWDEASDYIDGIPSGTVKDIYIGKIDIDYNDLEFRVSPRISDLVEDIKSHGQQFPVILRGIEESRKYQLVSGYRRVRAIKALGWKTVKAIVRDDMDDDLAYRVSFLENEKRKDLTGVDKAHAIVKLELLGKKPAEVQEIYGIGESQYQRYKKVGTFPKTLKNAIAEKRITTGHGLTLMQAYEQNPGKVTLEKWIEIIEEGDLSVRQLQIALNSEFGKPKKRTRYMDKQKGGGFKLYPMTYNPKITSNDKKKKMLEILREAMNALEKQP